MKMLIFGLGYSGQYIAKSFAGDVVGTTRSADKRNALKSKGFKVELFDGTMTDAVALQLKDTTHLVISASPSEAGDPVLPALGELKKTCPNLQWVGYLSTVGVYGNFDGAWISEKTPPDPVSKRGQWRVAAENAWAAACRNAKVDFAIFRLAGIYGPGRSTFDKLRKGKSRRIIKPGQVFNRIHVVDIAQIVNAAARQQATGVFNGADHEPAPPQTVIEYAAKLANMPLPPEEPFETAEMTPMARSFYGDNKRCGNARLSKDLGITLKFPTYREGLEAILTQMSG
ncbi:SDR family oxidoreductase [Maritalea mediterranea]|uniref:SDR family oxidoreductase n=1 Tax=Maritalea mediterranea TaxID=2909667 RepID=A0ABS9E347_9HYPH|nr:SDR family oxidoreductase [Maritalea mediterranea]MCF4097300.1 SDR family oxidoreductase [Maritalea mediterranea]